jgi:hypothetical protein
MDITATFYAEVVISLPISEFNQVKSNSNYIYYISLISCSFSQIDISFKVQELTQPCWSYCRWWMM